MLIGLIPNTVLGGEVLQICVFTRILGNLQMLVKSVILFFAGYLNYSFSGGWDGGAFIKVTMRNGVSVFERHFYVCL